MHVMRAYDPIGTLLNRVFRLDDLAEEYAGDDAAQCVISAELARVLTQLAELDAKAKAH